METMLRTALWRQFGSAIDMLENALVNCPASLWTQPLWREPSDQPQSEDFPKEFAEFWYLSYHALFWLDLYMAGVPEENFAPPAPFTRAAPELDPAGVPPEQPYTKEELLTYLASLRRKCHDTLIGLTDERANQTVEYPWMKGQVVSFLELQLYNMRHVQEHAAQLSLFLGQNAVPDVPDWVTLAKDEPSRS